MHTVSPKKMVTINILNILKRFSDAEHPMTQQEIKEKLKTEYNMEVDRKTVKRNLMNLLDLDCGIEYEEISRNDDEGNETSICTNWYIQPEFDDSELRLLIDSLLFSKNIPYKQCKNLIEKLIGLSNEYFNKKVNHICNLPDNQPQNKELFFIIDTLEEAISDNKKVSFVYNNYGIDKKLHPRRKEPYIVNPYQMVATGGRYYLICNYDKYNSLANYRIDRMTDIKILEDIRKPIEELDEGGLNLPKHMAEHLYMFAGESIHAKFRAHTYLIDQIIDWYGQDVKISPLTNDECMVEVKVNQEAFFYWALQYGPHIEVMEPAAMRARVKKAVEDMCAKYK
ncbi:MAG: WYL domain-containing protein [Ruminococcaceae bacterium]|nr:WYL domain-containing protein [Oscillospiraceae bacterium]